MYFAYEKQAKNASLLSVSYCAGSKSFSGCWVLTHFQEASPLLTSFFSDGQKTANPFDGSWFWFDIPHQDELPRYYQAMAPPLKIRRTIECVSINKGCNKHGSHI